MKKTILTGLAIVMLSLIVTSCASSEKNHFKTWDSYKNCSAYH